MDGLKHNCRAMDSERQPRPANHEACRKLVSQKRLARRPSWHVNATSSRYDRTNCPDHEPTSRLPVADLGNLLFLRWYRQNAGTGEDSTRLVLKDARACVLIEESRITDALFGMTTNLTTIAVFRKTSLPSMRWPILRRDCVASFNPVPVNKMIRLKTQYSRSSRSPF